MVAMDSNAEVSAQQSALAHSNRHTESKQFRTYQSVSSKVLTVLQKFDTDQADIVVAIHEMKWL